jgi:hypothetical protein
MQPGKMKPQVDRTYGESHALQWVREAFVNAREAGATKVHFGIEWRAVEATGTYRRIIADNGCGFGPDDHARFFNTFGGGGKPIGGPHENYGIGFKTSVLPWNKLGVVIISLRDGVESMSRVYLNEEADEYGMKVEPSDEGELLSVWQPGEDDEFKIDWADVIPEFVREAGHGTVLVLLGNNPDQDTILGDPDRPVEATVDAIVRYMNVRFWDLAAVDVTVDAVMSSEKRRWPNAGAAKSGGGRMASWSTLRPFGMYKATIDRATEKSKLPKGNQGTVPLADGLVTADWYLREGEPLPNARAQNTGFVAALYRGELYNLSDKASMMRSFGIGAIRHNAFVVLRPREAASRIDGVYPDTSRTGLKLGGATGGVDLPISDWAQEFASKLPEPIIEAIKATMSSVDGEITDNEWKKRLAERYGSRWRISKLLMDPNGAQRGILVQALGSRNRKRPGPTEPGTRPWLPESDGPAAKPRIGDPEPSGEPANQKQVAGGLPDYRIVGADQIGENGSWALAVFQRPNKVEPSGVVLINRDHKVLKQHIDELSKKYPEHLGDVVEREVQKVYGEVAVAHIAHSEQMKKLMPAIRVEDSLRSDESLTMALLGLWQIEAIALARLQGKLQQAQLKSAS